METGDPNVATMDRFCDDSSKSVMQETCRLMTQLFWVEAGPGLVTRCSQRFGTNIRLWGPKGKAGAGGASARHKRLIA